ncbi:hypothetical protein BDV12DRAFT_178502 [Aspergillus spectabilis]
MRYRILTIDNVPRTHTEMLARLVISASLAASMCAPFYLPYTTSRRSSNGRSISSLRARQYPTIGPIFHLY